MSGGEVRDVVVIGGGVSGLAAAGALADGGADVVLLEARGRLGGRVHSLHDPSWPLPIEMGAEFVDVPGPAFDAIRAMNGAAVRSAGGQWEAADGVARCLSFDDAIEGVLGRLDPPPEHDESFAEWLDGLGDQVDERARSLVKRYVEGFHASELDRVGIQWLAMTIKGAGGGGGEVRWHPMGGFGLAVRGLAVPLAGRCDVRLGAAVTAIDWRRDHVEVRCRSRFGTELEPVRARRVLITVPLAVLQAGEGSQGAIRITPTLDGKREIVSRLAMGQVVKIVFRFREPFWEDVLKWTGDDEGTREHKFFMSSGDFNAWWTPSPVRAPVLTAWAGGGAALRLMSRGGDPAARAMDSLARILGVPAARVHDEVEDWRRHDWHADPFAGGAYTYVPAGALPAQRALAEPVDGTLFFAGEATAEDGWNGTVDGAIRTGRRAAKEILASLSGSARR
ncbi:MAG: FAD-dependent oxidoreductase [Gemmatimonadetes bacterium]|nr:FAD-dependent oxidoreductase [Gemmatimonadota bacterium]